jgi:hypothetical protein
MTATRGSDNMTQINIHQVLGQEIGQEIIDKIKKIEKRDVSSHEALGLVLSRLLDHLDDDGNLIVNGGTF